MTLEEFVEIVTMFRLWGARLVTCPYVAIRIVLNGLSLLIMTIYVLQMSLMPTKRIAC